jgi:hypothetical protein
MPQEREDLDDNGLEGEEEVRFLILTLLGSSLRLLGRL